MRALAFAVALAAGLALAGGIPFNPSVTYTFTDCAAGGSASQNVQAGTYLLTVTDSDVFICYAATCASGGFRLPMGMAALWTFPGQQGALTAVSCRSSGSTGDLNLALAPQ